MQGYSYVGPIGITDNHQAVSVRTIGKGCFTNKLGQIPGSEADIFLIENPFRKPPEEPGQTILQHFSLGAQPEPSSGRWATSWLPTLRRRMASHKAPNKSDLAPYKANG